MNNNIKRKILELEHLYCNTTNTQTNNIRYINNLMSFLTKYNSGISLYKLNSDLTDWKTLN
jgi:hypothetical protein